MITITSFLSVIWLPQDHLWANDKHSLTHSMLITAQLSVGVEAGTFKFLKQCAIPRTMLISANIH